MKTSIEFKAGTGTLI